MFIVTLAYFFFHIAAPLLPFQGGCFHPFVGELNPFTPKT